jgi:glyoxylate reductase
LILACLKSLLTADAAVRSGVWRPPILTLDLYGATVGIVGFGRIGQAVARRLIGFDCRILVVESRPDLDAVDRLGVEVMTLAEVLPQVDVLTLHLPLSPDTHHLIGADELRLMPRHAVLVNTCRGPVIDQPALVAALREGVIGAAGLDVFEHEPLPFDDEMTTVPAVTLSGHFASFTEQGAGNMLSAIVTAFMSLSQGKTPAGCINAEALRVNRVD